MDIRFTTDNVSYKRMTTEELKKLFLIDKLFGHDEIYMLYSDIDRSITGSAVPVEKPLLLQSSKKEMAAEYFLERREMGIINIGQNGKVLADGVEYKLNFKDALYLGRGIKHVEFFSDKKEEPAKFYFVSYPAHKEYPSAHKKFTDATPVKLGSQADANKRTIYKYIFPAGIKSCQLVMGLTELDEGSVWNTMPVHTHQRRSEVYMYFNMKKDAILFHLLGEPTETRHLVLRNEQAVLSPSWSIHSGVATTAYTFIWAMGGENQDFDDMDWVAMKDVN
ncbi:MAG TPA: 5-dehydro-4-deoxy-D-glucuronate isomerase [Ignavibacteriaceae bacterium]|jgi:4-deoxy-L-threo-5-hexosulose-uronate ketol-isomerase|nr:5-dehydro-4-deoxy-D-glucuronate isomerase [Ignavibacteriaceae bacterium]